MDMFYVMDDTFDFEEKIFFRKKIVEKNLMTKYLDYFANIVKLTHVHEKNIDVFFIRLFFDDFFSQKIFFHKKSKDLSLI